ncbi:MAG: hypothetical protein HZC28_11440 [Spirochaetes bacterium]|nr:hypothetical protein [Spirochaetota bacterium]
MMMEQGGVMGGIVTKITARYSCRGAGIGRYASAFISTWKLIAVIASCVVVCGATLPLPPSPGQRMHHGVVLDWPGAFESKYAEYTLSSGKKPSIIARFTHAWNNGTFIDASNQYYINYHAWGTAWATGNSNIGQVLSKGAIPLIKMTTTDWNYPSTKCHMLVRQILSHTYDGFFAVMANTLKSYASPIIMTINHEMNGNWYDYGELYTVLHTNESDWYATNYIKAFRYIRDYLTSAGVTNVLYAFAPDVSGSSGSVNGTYYYASNSFVPYYPGDSYVDIIAPSFYNKTAPDSMKYIAHAYPSKPIIVSEGGLITDFSNYYNNPDYGNTPTVYPGHLSWITNFMLTMPQKYTNVVGICWFEFGSGYDFSSFGTAVSNAYVNCLTNGMYIHADSAAAPVIAGAPASFITNKPFVIALSVNRNYGYWSTNGSVFNQFGISGTSITVNRTTTLLYYGSDTVNGLTGATNSRVYTFDTAAPSTGISPAASFTTNKAFTSVLTVNENYGYWSTNGTVFNQFSTNGASVAVARSTTLLYYGKDMLGNTSATNSVAYTFDTNAPVVSGAPANCSTNAGFTVNLGVNENYGYWSTNGTAFTQFTTAGAGISITRTTSLYMLGRDVLGNTGPTNVRTYIVDAGLPVMPSLVVITNTDGNTVIVSWNDMSTNETAFRIYRSTNGMNFVHAGSVAPNTVTFTNTNLFCDTRYYYSVSSTNAAGESMLSAPVSYSAASQCAVSGASCTLDTAGGAVRLYYTLTKNCRESATVVFSVSSAGSNDYSAPGGTLSGTASYVSSGSCSNVWAPPEGFDMSRRYDLRITPFVGTNAGTSCIITAVDVSRLFIMGTDMDHIIPVGSPCRNCSAVYLGNVPAGTTARVYSIAGKLVASHLVSAGGNTLMWDLKTIDGRRAAPGVYLCHLNSTKGTAIARVMIVQ